MINIPEYKLLPRYKTFNGVKYEWLNELPRKDLAQREAAHVRSKNMKARVVKGGSSGWAYTVYIKK